VKRNSLMVLFALFAVLLFVACGNSDDVDGDIDGDDETITDGDTGESDDMDGDIEDFESDYSKDGDIDGDEEEVEAGEPFRFLVISDTHIRLPGRPDDGLYDNQGNIDNLEASVSRINDEFSEADFVAVTGDLVGCLYSEDPDDYGIGGENTAETFKSTMDDLTMPYHVTLGNHDYQKDYDSDIDEGITTDNIENIEAVWKKVLGIDPYYSIVHNGVRMIFLNANRGVHNGILCGGCTVEAFCTGSFDDAQIEWLEDELAEDESSIIFVHHPPVSDDPDAMFSMLTSFAIETEEAFYDVIESGSDKVIAIFAGHGHIWERDTMFDTIQVFETCSTGDTNGNGDNIHIVDVVPAEKSIVVSHGRDGESVYWGEWK